MKLIHNVTQKAYTRIDSFTQLYVGECQDQILTPYAVVVHLENKGVMPVGLFGTEKEALKVLESIILFLLKSDANVFKIQNTAKDTVLVTPDSMKDSGKTIKIVK